MPRKPLIPEGACRVVNGKRICRKEGKYYISGQPTKASEASKLIKKKKPPIPKARKPIGRKVIRRRPAKKIEVEDCGCGG